MQFVLANLIIEYQIKRDLHLQHAYKTKGLQSDAKPTLNRTTIQFRDSTKTNAK